MRMLVSIFLVNQETELLFSVVFQELCKCALIFTGRFSFKHKGQQYLPRSLCQALPLALWGSGFKAFP